MDEVQIKNEFYDICYTCLSTGRSLYPLGEFEDVFKKLTFAFENQTDTAAVQICWECRRLLLRVTQFQQQARTAMNLLRNGQMYMFGSLSNLKTIVISNDTNITIYLEGMDTTNKHTNKQSEIKTDALIDNEENEINIFEEPTYDEESVKDEENEMNKGTNTGSDEVNNEEISDKNDKVTVKKKPSKWAIERKLQNEKEKFKILTNPQEYREVGMSETELCDLLMRERDSAKALDCDGCCDTFNCERKFVEHLRVCQEKHSSNTSDLRRYECGICKFSCYTHISIQKHMRTHKRVFQCVTCGVMCVNRREFFKHHKEWHEKFICDHCGVSFKMRYCIEKHIRSKHSGLPHVCPVCGCTYARAGGLWLHTRLRHRAPAPAYCVECDRTFTHPAKYSWHLATSVRHRERKVVRVPCLGCDKVFTKKSYMKEHYDMVHMRIYKYVCDKCPKHFVRNADLVKHRRRVHEGVLPPRNKVCHVCGKGFTTNKILIRHTRTHTGPPHTDARRAMRDNPSVEQ